MTMKVTVMTHPPPEISFEPSPVQVASEWHVIARYPTGEEEHIAGFLGEAEAQAWLRGEGRREWLAGRGLSEFTELPNKGPPPNVHYTEGDMHGTTEIDPTTQQRPLPRP